MEEKMTSKELKNRVISLELNVADHERKIGKLEDQVSALFLGLKAKGIIKELKE